MSRLRDALSRFPVARLTTTRWVAVVAALLSSPALFHGFEVDDRLHRQAALGVGRFGDMSSSPFDMFTFFTGDPARTSRYIDHGFTPWWTDPHVRVSFLRPLSSLLHWFDHHVLRHAVAIHAHSILWYVLVVVAAATLYRRLLGATWVAGLAALMYAVDHTHGLLAGWIANRNATVAGAFALAAVVLHDRARKERSTRDAVLASFALGLALFSAEAGLGIVGYLVAHAFTLERERGARRLRGLVPYAAPLLLWAVVYKLGDHGARGSGLYIDPGRQPVEWLRRVVQHEPLLLGGELGVPGIDFHPFLGASGRAVLLAACLAVLAAFAIAIAPLFRRDATTRFFVIGAALSALPACATFPSSRLLLLPSFGLLGAVAQLFAAWRDRAEWLPARQPRRALTIGMAAYEGFGHLVLSPIVFILALNQMVLFEGVVERHARGLPDDPRLSSQRLLIVNAPDAAFASYITILREDRGQVVPAKLLVMGVGVRPLELVRLDDRTVTLASAAGLVGDSTDRLTRGYEPFIVGEVVKLSDLTVEIIEVNADGVPTVVCFSFARPLENEAFRWMQWKDQTLAPFTPPKVGERVSFPAQTIQIGP
ncbi:MAG: hypothetical protein HYV09_02900 [Deltaproteobacteria bacterium]|nr:hypothetical protein [Deltaproteobacteria bacterium]